MLFKNYLPLLIMVSLAQVLTAQSVKVPRHQRWELGLQAGVAQGQTDLIGLGTDEMNPGGGLLIRYHLDDVTAVRINAMYAEITGDDRFHEGFEERAFKFSAPLTETSLVFELDLFGKARWKEKHFKKIISPYIYGGGGYAFTRPYTNYNEAGNEGLRNAINSDKAQVYDGHVVVPMGFGVKFDLNENWVIGVETGVRLLFNDYLDGISQSGNPRKNDTYSMTGITASYRLSYVPDVDRDGIPDSEDACPDQKGTEKTRGCPDSDGDDIPDNTDGCPDQKGPYHTGGCPDSDNDGIADQSDQCPDAKGPIATAGCPDKDKDGIADAQDSCPDEYGPAKLKGCPDSDGDGMINSEDECPDRAGSIENKGCPVNDRDRDGVVDADDRCPDTPGSASFSGCPDTDKDGLGDNVDKCPEVAGPPSNSGCPLVAEEDKKILENALYGVQFDSGKSSIKAGSDVILDQVADVMNRNQAYDMTISGHTDSAGNDASNQRLSENRAKACYDYLISKGVSATRMKYSGYGESKPVADNGTAAGKSKNRRVEFELNLR